MGIRQRGPLSTDPLIQLVHHIYEGALDPHAWPGIVEHVAKHMATPKGFLFTPFVGSDKGGLGISCGLTEASVQVWAARYIQHDVWTAIAGKRGLLRERNVLLDNELMPEVEFMQTLIYREFLRALDISKLCAGVVFDAESPHVVPTHVCVYRGAADRPFGDWERAQLALLLPHVSRALGVMYRLRDAELKVAASLAALDRLNFGVVLLHPNGSIASINREAARLFEADDGLTLKRTDSRHALVAHDAATQTALDTAIASSTFITALGAPHFSRSVAVPKRSGQRPFVLQFAPLPESNVFSNSGAPVAGIAFIVDQDRPPTTDAALLHKIFGISAAEARLAQLLCSGNTMSEAATKLAVSQDTVKTQLASLFRKTNTNRQADLIRLLISLGSTVA